MSHSSDFSPAALLRQIRERLAALPAESLPDHATMPAPPPTAAPELERLIERLDQLMVRLAEQDSTYAPLIERLGTLEKQISRAGREQFKATTLAEAQHEQTRSALELLQAAYGQQTREIERLQQALAQTREQVQLEQAQALLPVADSLDEALRAGQQVLARLATPISVSWLARLLGVDTAAQQHASEQRKAMQQWLHGLTFVQQRVLDLLHDVGITPISSVGTSYDPHLHVAVGVETATATSPEGHITQELRRGYRTAQRVLRHADVVVARAPLPRQASIDSTDTEATRSGL